MVLRRVQAVSHSAMYVYSYISGYSHGLTAQDTGSMSRILVMPQFLSYMNYPSNFLQGEITASIQAGAFAGSLLTGAFLADKLGRKRPCWWDLPYSRLESLYRPLPIMSLLWWPDA